VRRTSSSPSEYNEIICLAAAVRAVVTITVTTCFAKRKVRERFIITTLSRRKNATRQSTSSKSASEHRNRLVELIGRRYTRYTVHKFGGTNKRGHRLMTIILSNLNRFTNCFQCKIP